MDRNQMFDRLCAYQNDFVEIKYLDELPTQEQVDAYRRFMTKVCASPHEDKEFLDVLRSCVIQFSDMMIRAEGRLK